MLASTSSKMIKRFRRQWGCSVRSSSTARRRRVRPPAWEGPGLSIAATFVAPAVIQFLAAMLLDVLIVVGVAGWEELVFRGYLVKNVAEGLSDGALGSRWATAVAVLVPGAFFGWLHAINPNATVLGVINVVIFGLPFGVVRADRRVDSSARPALRMGLH